MSINGNISFRSMILGRIEGFVDSTGIIPLISKESLAQLIVAISNYTEEGKSFSPPIYITTDLDKLLRFIPGNSRIKIGELGIDDNSPCVALKRCAPLATDGWCIYLDCKADKVFYGVFRDSLAPLAIPLEKALLQDGSGETKVLRTQQSAPSCVELTNHNGDSHTIFISDKREAEPSPRQFVSDLAQAICSELKADIRPSAQTVIEKALNNGLEASHGALVAVTRKDKPPQFLQDGLLLNEPLNFGELARKALHGNEQDRMRLISFTKVLEGMFGCDGIIVFNRKATLIGYNCFIKPSAKKTPASGGARKRAYGALQTRLGKGLFATFIRSQDGWSEFKQISQ
ncbi:hypothetical protein AAFN60_08925 [Roseibacillus persicicus]|uniref:hypothetical protein n=1 Tax=Roseibacillus persicicus TaxID=454148 RepID=UPI00398B089E